MAPKAARVGDPTEHQDKPLGPGSGSSDVDIAGKKAWRAMDDLHTCGETEHGTEICYMGSLTVLINGQMAVREGDKLVAASAPNSVKTGESNVIIDDPGFGLLDPKNAKEFCEDFCKVVEDWPNLEDDARLEAVKGTFNKQLEKLGVPPLDIGTNLSGAANGKVIVAEWTMHINPRLLSQSPLPPDTAKNLGQTLYHEARHAEQRYALVRYRAGTGANAREIWRSTGIPFDVVEAGVESPVGASTAVGTLGRMIFQSSFSDRFEYRKQLLTEVSQNPYGEGNRYAEYRALPEEIDARKGEDLLANCTCQPEPQGSP